MTKKGRTQIEFESTFGVPKLKRLEHDLAVEREKGRGAVRPKGPRPH